MVQFSQTSWQEYSLENVLETLRFAPMSLAVAKTPILYYTLPKSLDPSEQIKYTLVSGFNKYNWTGVIASFDSEKNILTVRQPQDSPFRGFLASHEFRSAGNMTTCVDTLKFQGLKDFSEEAFSSVMEKACISYAIAGRKAARDIYLDVESKKQTKRFEALNQSEAAG